jgi:hypothetical protein
MPEGARQRLIQFAAVFFAVNLAFDAYRAGGLTVGAFGSAAVVTILATVLYAIYLRWRAGRKPRD